jgi:hypothetical protein
MKHMQRLGHAHLFKSLKSLKSVAKKPSTGAPAAFVQFLPRRFAGPWWWILQRRLAAGHPPELQWEQALPAFRSW